MVRSGLVCALAAILLAFTASTSAQQGPPTGGGSPDTGLRTPNQGSVPDVPELPTKKGALAPPVMDGLGSSNSPLMHLAGDSSRSPPPPTPAQLSGNPPVEPASGSPPPPPIERPVNETPTGGGKEKSGGDGSAAVPVASDEEVLSMFLEKNGSKCGGDVIFGLFVPEKDPQKQFLVVRNKGKNPLDVSFVKLPSTPIVEPFTVQANKTIKKELRSGTHLNNTQLQLVIDNGKTRCHLSAVPPVPLPQPSVPFNLFQFPDYAASVTPVSAAYALVFAILIAAIIWACCRFRKKSRRVDSSIPYQQLEMGMQARPSHIPDTRNTVDGWEEGWNDAWDDEEAATGHPPGAEVLSNAAAGRPSAKDGWEDWDD